MAMGVRNFLCTLLLFCFAIGPIRLAWGDNDVLRNLIEKGDFNAALALVDAALDNRPTNASMLLHRGFLLVSLGQLETAESHYRNMKTTHPDMPEPGNNLAIVYRNQGRMLDALQTLEQVIDDFPLFEQAHDNLREICSDPPLNASAEDSDVTGFCDAFDHAAATAAREAAREAQPLVVEKDHVVEVIALRPVEFTSAPLDDGGPSETLVVGSDEVNASLRRELADLAEEFESFRGRMESELDAAVAARAEADETVASLEAENVTLTQQIATFESEVVDLEQRLQQSEQQHKIAVQSASDSDAALATMEASMLAAEEGRASAEQRIVDLEQQLQQSERKHEDAIRSVSDSDAALASMEASMLAAEEGRASAEQRIVDLESELSVSREELQRVETVGATRETDMAAVKQELTTTQEQLAAERQAREMAEQQINELNQQLAELQDQLATMRSAQEATLAEASQPPPEEPNVAEEAGSAGASDNDELTAVESAEVAGAAEARMDQPEEAQADPVTAPLSNEARFRQWSALFDNVEGAGAFLTPPDHIRWQVEHVVNRWFETYQSDDVDAHLALYSPTFVAFSGPRLTEWLGRRFPEQAVDGAIEPNPAWHRLRQTAADAVVVYLPSFNSLPGASGGQVTSLLLRYRHGRWQIFRETTDADGEEPAA